jgi:hypothetical protein
LKTCYQQGDQLIVKSNYIAILNNLFIEFRAAQVANLRQQRETGLAICIDFPIFYTFILSYV